jgi:putative hydrolase of the HAD superfamily
MTTGFTDVDEFLAYVHPEDPAEYLDSEHAETAQMVLDQLDVPASVLTNAPKEHAVRVLDRLGIRDRFEHLFDLRWANFVGKPSKQVYQRVLEHTSSEPGETLLADDVLQYLLPFRGLGGQIVHVSAAGQVEPGIPTIRALRELPPYVRPERSNS